MSTWYSFLIRHWRNGVEDRRNEFGNSFVGEWMEHIRWKIILWYSIYRIPVKQLLGKRLRFMVTIFHSLGSNCGDKLSFLSFFSFQCSGNNMGFRIKRFWLSQSTIHLINYCLWIMFPLWTKNMKSLVNHQVLNRNLAVIIITPQG
jgi:hypothetical protein